MNLNGLRKEIAQLKAVPGVVEGKPVPAPVFLGPNDPRPTNGAHVFLVRDPAMREKLRSGCPVLEG
jgi:hypothetical protein